MIIICIKKKMRLGFCIDKKLFHIQILYQTRNCLSTYRYCLFDLEMFDRPEIRQAKSLFIIQTCGYHKRELDFDQKIPQYPSSFIHRKWGSCHRHGLKFALQWTVNRIDMESKNPFTIWFLSAVDSFINPNLSQDELSKSFYQIREHSFTSSDAIIVKSVKMPQVLRKTKSNKNRTMTDFWRH